MALRQRHAVLWEIWALTGNPWRCLSIGVTSTCGEVHLLQDGQHSCKLGWLQVTAIREFLLNQDFPSADVVVKSSSDNFKPRWWRKPGITSSFDHLEFPSCRRRGRANFEWVQVLPIQGFLLPNSLSMTSSYGYPGFPPCRLRDHVILGWPEVMATGYQRVSIRQTPWSYQP